MDRSRFASFCELIRYSNLIFLAIIIWVMERVVAKPLIALWNPVTPLPWWVLTLLIVAVVAIAAAGYAVNDYFDIKIDRINRPDKVLVTTVFSKDETMCFVYILMTLGIMAGVGVAAWAKSWTVGFIFPIVAGLLWFYSASYKRQFLVGNLIVAFLAGLVPLLILLIHMPYSGIWLPIYGGYALFAFGLTLIREIIKDLQDQVGDRELECHSLPIVLGDTWTKAIVTLLLIVAMAGLAYVGWFTPKLAESWGAIQKYITLGLLVPLAGDIALLWSAKIPSDYRSAQLLIKFVMFMGVMSAFVLKNYL